MKQPDFIARLTYKTTEEGGRKNAAKSGYRPQVKFAFSEMQTSGQQIFIDKETVHPGESVVAEIAIASPQFFEHKLYIGILFEFREGNTIIGIGEIIEIFNTTLIKS